jgi:hypothetical protein
MDMTHALFAGIVQTLCSKGMHAFLNSHRPSGHPAALVAAQQALLG